MAGIQPSFCFSFQNLNFINPRYRFIHRFPPTEIPMPALDFHGIEKLPLQINRDKLREHATGLLLTGRFDAFPGCHLNRICIRCQKVMPDDKFWRLTAGGLIRRNSSGPVYTWDAATGDAAEIPAEILLPSVGKDVFADRWLGTEEYPFGTRADWPTLQLYSTTLDSGGWFYGGYPKLQKRNIFGSPLEKPEPAA
jgi:hypothetical protein